MDGEEPIAYGLRDPSNGVMRVLPIGPADRDPLDGLNQAFFARRLRRAIEWRETLGLVEGAKAYRLVNAEGDDLAGFTIDVYAGHVLIHTFSDDFASYLAPLAAALKETLRPHSIVAKVRPAGEVPAGRIPYTLLSDEPPPPSLTVDEMGVQYEVHLLGGFNTGLFTDMRDVRHFIGQISERRHLLNLFSYTGSFSVVAALTGAASVTSVEFAAGTLQWSKANFKLNELPVDDARHRFVKGDVFEFLKSERRSERQYDLIVLDPPATTVVPGRRWFLKTDYDRLIGHALRVLAPGGIMLIAASTLTTRPEGVEKQIKTAARDHGRRLRMLQSFGLPPDYPTQMIHPESRYLKAYVVQAD